MRYQVFYQRVIPQDGGVVLCCNTLRAASWEALPCPVSCANHSYCSANIERVCGLKILKSEGFGFVAFGYIFNDPPVQLF